MFDFVFAIFPILFIGALVFIVFSAYRNYQAARRGGVDPFAVETELKVKTINSDLLKSAEPVRAAKSLEDRLTEIEDLHRRGVITNEERAVARAEILAGD